MDKEMAFTVDPSSLVSVVMTEPSVLPSWKNGLPRRSAVYFALAASGKVLYVGRAKNLRKRWYGHDQERVLRTGGFGEVRIAWLEVGEDRLCEVETSLIRQFAPLLNARGTTRAPYRARAPYGDVGGPWKTRYTALQQKYLDQQRHINKMRIYYLEEINALQGLPPYDDPRYDDAVAASRG